MKLGIVVVGEIVGIRLGRVVGAEVMKTWSAVVSKPRFVKPSVISSVALFKFSEASVTSTTILISVVISSSTATVVISNSGRTSWTSLFKILVVLSNDKISWRFSASSKESELMM